MLQIAYSIIDTSIGPVLIAQTAKGVCAVLFGSTERLPEQLERLFPDAEIGRDDTALEAAAVAVNEAIAGREWASVPLDLHGTEFQRDVWNAMREIPRGRTASYSDLAAAVGRPRAYRAAANACGDNPVAILVPCHRVIRADGSIGGYGFGAGLDTKRALLAAEGVTPPE